MEVEQGNVGEHEIFLPSTPPCNVESLLKLLAENTPFLIEGEGEGYGLFCSPKLPHLRAVSRKCFEVPGVAWATSLKKAVLHGQEFLPLPFSTLPHPTACFLTPQPQNYRCATLRLPYPPYPSNWSLAPQPQNGRRATLLRSLIRTGVPSVSPTHPTSPTGL